MFDFVIKNSKIVDPVDGIYLSDIGIKNGKISHIGKIKQKNKIVDVNGNFVFPGFIDNHSHSDLSAVYEGINHPSIKQGALTSVVGNCGLGIFPYPGKEWFEVWKSVFGNYRVPVLKDISSFLNFIKKSKLELLPLLPYNTLRYHFFKNKEKLSKVENKKIFDFIDINLEYFYGLSIGLTYSPANFLDKKEIFKIFERVKKKNKFVACHIRNEGKSLISSLKEVLDVAIKLEIPIIISHFKSYGKKNWGKMERAIELVENAAKKTKIGFDVYPYTSGSTSLYSFLPDELLKLEKEKVLKILKKNNVKIKEPYLGWENIKIIGYPEYEYLSIKEAARREGKKEEEIFKKILIETEGKAGVVLEGMKEENVIRLLKHPLSRLGSDSLFGKPHHIRTEEAFKKFLFYYVKTKKIFSPVEATKKLSYNQSIWFNLKKGRILKNYDADIVIVDMKNERIEFVLKQGKKLN